MQRAVECFSWNLHDQLLQYSVSERYAASRFLVMPLLPRTQRWNSIVCTEGTKTRKHCGKWLSMLPRQFACPLVSSDCLRSRQMQIRRFLYKMKHGSEVDFAFSSQSTMHGIRRHMTSLAHMWHLILNSVVAEGVMLYFGPASDALWSPFLYCRRFTERFREIARETWSDSLIRLFGPGTSDHWAAPPQ
jgi:hypothetical protein